MFNIISNFFTKKKRILQEALAEGATIIDVRTAGEFNTGNVPGSINIPLDKVGHKIKKIEKLKMPLVLCCASGIRSASAVQMLKLKGIKQIHNGGSWNRVYRLLNE